MAIRKPKSEKIDKRRRSRVWCGEYQADSPTRKAYRYISYNGTRDDLERQTQLAREQWGAGVYAHLRKAPNVPTAALPVTEGQPIIIIDSQGQKSTTFGEFAWQWYHLYKGSADISENGKGDYRYKISAHLVPTFGVRMIRDISVSELQQFLNRFEGMSYSSVHKMLLTIKQIFQQAVLEKLVDRDVLDQLATMKMPRTTKGERRALTEEEQVVMLSLGRTHKEGLFLLVLFWLGVRRGEALAIRWSDIDFADRVVYIYKDVDFKQKSPNKLGDVKSETSHRYVPVPDELLAILEAVRPAKDILAVETRQRKDFVFRGKRSGKPLSEASFKRMWERLMIAACEVDPTIEVKQIKGKCNHGKWQSILTPHYFRHNYCTMLCDAGVSEMEAVAWMGHEDSELIKKVYSHRSKKARAKNDSVFRKFAKEHRQYLQEPSGVANEGGEFWAVGI